MSLACLLAALPLQPVGLQLKYIGALAAGEAATRALFVDPAQAEGLIELAGREGGLAAQFPVIDEGPDGRKWVIFSRARQIQQDWDRVYFVEADGRIGAERPAWEDGGWRIESAEAEVDFFPKADPAGNPPEGAGEARIRAVLQVKAGTGPLVLRLNSPYQVQEMRWNGRAAPFRRLGSLLWSPGQTESGRIELNFFAALGDKSGDHVGRDLAHLTAWWMPTINRLPHPTQVKVSGPEAWELWSEGEHLGTTVKDGRKTSAFRCRVPISFPKAMGGLYSLAGEKHAGSVVLRSWQRSPVESDRAAADISRLERGLQFFSERLGPFPFDRYEVIDAEGFYGIESYTHTLLRRSITTRFATHELLHTWLGGLAPCAYTRDTWNEGFTQYIDSVLFQGNSDGTLQQGYRARSVSVPLDRMGIAWANGNASYTRGAYTARMLHQEVGDKAFWRAMKAICKEGIGQDLSWIELRPFFERASGMDLDWFWRQWVSGAAFPTLKVISKSEVQPGLWAVIVEQSGAPKPFRLKVGWKGAAEPALVTEARQIIRISSEAEPEIELFPHTLASLAEG
jgi:hypothetical protein